MTLQTGEQFDHYEIRSHIAQGGMSDIYRAYDVLSGKEVALKIPDKMMIGDPAQYERFQRELEAMRTLQHPSLQHGIESGKYNRTPYLVTELVDGQSMRALIKEQAPLPVDQALSLAHKIAEGMAYCHDHDVIHRDLKPENILISKDGQPVILDFGLALTKGARRVTYANFSGTAGTPDYMAPEQVEGQRGDKRTDIYALGTMLYEMLTGTLPFAGVDQMKVMAAHLQGAIPRLDKVKPGISPQIATVVAKALQRDPEQRYPDMAAFIHDLDHLDSVDISMLEKFSATPPKTSFWRTQTGRGLITGVVMLGVIILLAIVLVALRH